MKVTDNIWQNIDGSLWRLLDGDCTGRKYRVVEAECSWCGNKCYLSPYTLPKYKNHYCNWSCATSARNWKGGTTINMGYIRNSGTRGNGGYAHKLKAEKVIGRKLRRGECVHHINGNKLDNRNKNLLICTQQYHRWLHNRMAQLFMEEKFGSY